MIHLLFIIGLPFRAMSPNQKMDAVLSVQQNNKMADRSDLMPSPLPCVVTKLLIFEEKGWVISDTIYARETTQYCLNTKQQITPKFNV